MQLHISRTSRDPMYKFIGIELENIGPGAAYVFPLQFYVDDQPIAFNLPDQVKKFTAMLPPTVSTMTIPEVALVPAGTRRGLVWMSPQDYGGSNEQRFTELLPRISVVGFYASKFGDVRLIASRLPPGSTPESLRRQYGIPRRVKLEFG